MAARMLVSDAANPPASLYAGTSTEIVTRPLYGPAERAVGCADAHVSAAAARAGRCRRRPPRPVGTGAGAPAGARARYRHRHAAARAQQRHHRRRRRAGRPRHDRARRGRAQGRRRSGAHRRHRGAAAPGHLVHRGLRRHLHAERRRRDDRDALDPRPRDAGAPDPHHQHRQHRRRARRRHRLHDRAPPQARLGLPAGGGRDLGRHVERHPRPSRAEGARLRGARQCPRRTGGRGQRRRRHRDDLLPLQVRHRHLVATAAGRRRRLHRRRAGAGQLRRPRPAAHRRRAGRPRDPRGDCPTSSPTPASTRATRAR